MNTIENGDDLLVYVGSYGDTTNPGSGGIHLMRLAADGSVTREQHEPAPDQAGFLLINEERGVLYAVDERKNDGRHPSRPAGVHSFDVHPTSGALVWKACVDTVGPFPTYLAGGAWPGRVYSANHGSFDHVQRIVRDGDGRWRTETEYDDSCVVGYDLDARGHVRSVATVRILTGHGPDPNTSPQAGGRGQSSAHAHCAVLDPTGSALYVCDKGTDRIYTLDPTTLGIRSTIQLDPQTGPRHLVIDHNDPTRAYVTLEFASEVAALTVSADGALQLTERTSSTAPDFRGPNEPADLRLTPDGGALYVNNRGEDTLTWFTVDRSGSESHLVHAGSVALSPSLHPGVAARSFAIDASGRWLLVADRPADLVRRYRIQADYSLREAGAYPVPQPAHIALRTVSARRG